MFQNKVCSTKTQRATVKVSAKKKRRFHKFVKPPQSTSPPVSLRFSRSLRGAEKAGAKQTSHGGHRVGRVKHVQMNAHVPTRPDAADHL